MMNTRKKAERASIDSVKDAIKKKGGKSDKVIMVLLDMDTLRDSKSHDTDIDSALVIAGVELQRTNVAPEYEAFVFAKLTGTEGFSKAPP